MANYKSATPLELVAMGGHYYNEISYLQKRKCFVYNPGINATLEHYGCCFVKHSTINYSSNFNQIVALDDVELTAAQIQNNQQNNIESSEDLKYYFNNYDVPQTLFFRRSKYPISYNAQNDNNNFGSMNARVEQLQCTYGDGASVLSDNSSIPIVTYADSYFPSFEETVINYVVNEHPELMYISPDEYTSDSYSLQIANWDYSYTETHEQRPVFLDEENNYMAIMNSTEISESIETLTHEPFNGTLVGIRFPDGITVNSFGNVILIDFNGQNCRKKYFAWAVGPQEYPVYRFSEYGSYPNSPNEYLGFQGGFSSCYGIPNEPNLENKKYVYVRNGRAFGPSGEYMYYDTPIELNTEYKSIDSAWVDGVGFGVVFKDTSYTNGEFGNNLGREVFVLGNSTHDNDWNTDSRGMIIICVNFKMS